jgi:hypothetical protein
MPARSEKKAVPPVTLNFNKKKKPEYHMPKRKTKKVKEETKNVVKNVR